MKLRVSYEAFAKKAPRHPAAPDPGEAPERPRRGDGRGGGRGGGKGEAKEEDGDGGEEGEGGEGRTLMLKAEPSTRLRNKF